MRITACILLAAALAALSGCGRNGGEAQVEIYEGSLPYPEIPDSLRTPAARAAYLTEHFWDALDFGRSPQALDTAFVEQTFANYIDALQFVPDSLSAARAFGSLAQRSSQSPEALSLMAHVARKYLYEADSPFLNEPLYQAWLEQLLLAPSLGDAERARPEAELRQTRLCAVGSYAPDMAIVTADGKEARLGELWAERPVLLMFYENDCENCRRAIEIMRESPAIRQAQEVIGLQVVAVDIAERASGEPLDGSWITAVPAPGVDIDELYVVRATPSIYMLTPRGRIAIKDGTLEMALSLLR